MLLKLFFLIGLMLSTITSFSQDTIILISGRIIPVKSVELHDYRVAFRKIPKEHSDKKPEEAGGKAKKSKVRTMDAERIFAIKYQDGSERIIYTPDSLDPYEFSREQMRLFINGEQDAAKYYKNNLNKAFGFGFGAASGLLGFYGLAGPPLYATIMGSFTPNLDKRLKKQNEMQETKKILDQMTVPVPPESSNTSLALDEKYQLDLKAYNTAQENYERAVKKHPDNIYFSDTKLMEHSEYREGYERKARDRKIRNALLSGMAGFVTLVVGLPIIY